MLPPCTKTMRVLSLGAGVQSTTLLLMAREGELRLEAAIFADTQWETAATYAHLDWLESVSSVPIYRVTVGNLRADALAGNPHAWMPVRTPKGVSRRQCTTNYKIVPIKRQLRELGATAKHPATVYKGISLDEVQRMNDPDVQYIRHAYPLIERRMTRGDCLAWLGAHGYPRPPRSACVGCPFRNTRDWQSIRAEPEEWADALAFDAAIRPSFLHFSLRPLADVDLRTDRERGQLDLFTDECAGVCGV